jgi:hypothetical protein
MLFKNCYIFLGQKRVNFSSAHFLKSCYTVYKLFQVIGVFFPLEIGGGPPSEFQPYIYMEKANLRQQPIVGSTIVHHRHEFLWKIWKAER